MGTMLVVLVALLGLSRADKCPGNNQYFSCDGPYSENCAGCCHCAEGYKRDTNNTCVSTTPPPKETHPAPTPPPIIIPSQPVEGPQPVTDGPRSVILCNTLGHEVAACVFEYCPPERTCQNVKLPLPVCGPTFPPCKPKCVCDEGYARNQKGGPCVTLEQCAKCGENEVFECNGDYSDDCTGFCNCLSGYTRDINDKCVYVDPAAPPKDFGPPDPEPESCWGTSCGESINLECNVTNHEITGCLYPCPPERTCQNRNWLPTPCARPLFPCTPKCICDNGYTRNQDGGTCVTEAQCDKCGENEYFQCDCDYSEDCVGHCYCYSGYTRDINDKCVYVDPASPPKDNGPPTPEPDDLECNVTNHEITGCLYPCPPERTCRNRNWPPPPCAPPAFPCTPKCICDNGYTRNQDGGTCVTEAQCDKCGENEYFQCDCDYSEDCVGHCYCYSGYTRDINDKCVYVDPASPPKDNGPPTPEPDDLECNVTNHEITGCIYPCPPERTCQNRNWPPPPCARPPFPCTPKCICDNGYTRNQDGGTCVTEAQCDKCGENEYFQCDCDYSEDCVGHCYCYSGYTRDINDKCVYVDPASPPKDNGPPTPEPDDLECNVTNHEIAGCIYGCPPERTCQNRNWPPLPCAPPPFPCTPKCICDNGYSRNQDGGTCVTEAQCDKCGENEYFQCDCDYSEDCVGHCYCYSGYTRDINDKCVYVDPASPPKDNGPPTPEPDGPSCSNH